MDYNSCYVTMYPFPPFISDNILVEAVRVCASPLDVISVISIELARDELAKLWWVGYRTCMNAVGCRGREGITACENAKN